MKLVQKKNDDPIEISKREKYMIELESDLRIKNGKITRMMAKANIKRFWSFLPLLSCGDDFIIELYMKNLTNQYNVFLEIH